MKIPTGWERMRAWFLLPAWIWMAVLFAAPFAIVIVYSLLTRGAYGGLGLPWTLENYARLRDPLYLGIVLRSFVMAAATTAICLLLGFPLVALVMAIYFNLAFKPGSAVQNPEKLYREPGLMAWFAATVVVMVLLLFVRLAWLEKVFVPTLPVVQAAGGAAPVSSVVLPVTVGLS